MSARSPERSEAGARSDTLLLIGGRLQAIQKAKELGLRVVLLQHRDRLLPGQVEAADALLLIDYLDWDLVCPIVRAAHEVFGFGAVVSLVEQGLEPAGQISDVLGLGGTSYEVAHRFRDKLGMRWWLREMGFETVAAEQVGSAEELRRFGARHGYPFVLKPVDGTASRGVTRIDDPAEIEEIWRRAVDLRGRDDLAMAQFYPVDRFMAEEFIDGREYSVESFSFDGRHVVVSVTDKFTDGTVEVGHAEPAVLTVAEEAALVDHVVRFLEVMGLRDGVGHTEVKLSSRGPRIIEGHDRVSGDRVMDLVEAVYGLDLEQYAVGWPFRRVARLPDRPVPRGAAATRFLTAAAGVVTAIEGTNDVRACPGLLDLDLAVKVGDAVVEVADSFDRPGQVLVAADSTVAAVALATSLADRVRIITRPLDG
jgi:biotin carboxylase